MTLIHATIGNYLFDYCFEDPRNFLTISTPPAAEGALMLSWTPVTGVRLVRIVSDFNAGIEMQKEADLREFPILEVLVEIKSNVERFSKSDLEKIFYILDTLA